MLWIKTFHIVFVVTWFAGLFYLPRLFVYHAQSHDKIGIERFKVMERRLYHGIMTPSAVLTLITGIVLYAHFASVSGAWLTYKLVAVAFLAAYHVACWHHLIAFKHDRNTRSHVYYRWFNEVPTVLLVVIVALVVLKPF